MLPSYWQEATTYLTHIDAIMARWMAAYPDAVLVNHHNPFSTLLRAVVGQQISVKAADAIWQRLQGKLETLSPSQLLAVEEEALRQGGLSRQKISYLRAIACAFEEETLTPSTWEKMSDREMVCC
jgi:DNA-3-methyladenine glycosylase II